MTTIPHISDERRTMRQWLRRSLIWQIPPIGIIIVIELVVFLRSQAATTGVSAALLSWYILVLLWALAGVRRGELQRSVMGAAAALIAVGVVWSILGQISLALAMLLPGLALSLAMPFLDMGPMRRLAVCAWIAIVLSVLIVGVLGISSLAPPVIEAVLVLLTATVGAVSLLLALGFRERFIALMVRTEAAHSALREAHSELETQVRERTMEIRETLARYRVISELTSDYIYSARFTPDGDLVHEWITDAFTRITGYTPTELGVSGLWVQLMHPDDVPIVERTLQTIRAGKSYVEEFRIITRQGETRWLREYGMPEWDAAHEHVVRLLGAAQDITEHKLEEEQRVALERKLLETQKLESLGLLAGGIAHDFNNLLMVIQGNTSMALLELPPQSHASKSIVQVEIAAQRAIDLVRKMLAYAGKGQLVVQPVDLNALIDEMVVLLRASISSQVQIKTELDPELPLFDADATQIHQVIMNLVINAAEAIGNREGVIRLCTGKVYATTEYLNSTYLIPDQGEGDYIQFSITDTGSGMDPQTLSRIFDPFFTTKCTGTGLGLAAVIGIVRGHHGTLKVESKVGQGTTFTLLFPYLPVHHGHLVGELAAIAAEMSGRYNRR